MLEDKTECKKKGHNTPLKPSYDDWAFINIKLQVDLCRIYLLEYICEQENAIFAWYTSLFSFPFCACQPASWFSCLSRFRSFERWHDASGEAGRQGARGVWGGICLLFCVLPLAAKCLLSHHERICVYLSVCACFWSPFVSSRSGQASRMKIWSSITSS